MDIVLKIICLMNGDVKLKNLKIVTLIPFAILVIVHQCIDVSNFTVGLSYGIAIGIVILGFIPKEQYTKFKAFKKSLLKH